MENNKKNQLYIILFIFALFIVLISVFFIFPTIEEIKNKSKELFSEKNNLAFLDSEVVEVEKFESKYQQYEPDLKKIDSLYVDQKNLADFFEFLEKIADECQISIRTSMSQSSTKNSDLGFQIYAKGSFNQTVKFLDKVETGHYLLQVQKISYERGKNEKTDIVDAVFSITASQKNK